MKNGLKRFILTNWTLGEKSLVMMDLLLLGILLGWLTSPFKKLKSGIHYRFAGFDGNIPDEAIEEEQENK